MIYSGEVEISNPDAGELAHWLGAAWVDPRLIPATVAKLRRARGPFIMPAASCVTVERRKIGRRWAYRVSWKWDRLPAWRCGPDGR